MDNGSAYEDLMDPIVLLVRENVFVLSNHTLTSLNVLSHRVVYHGVVKITVI